MENKIVEKCPKCGNFTQGVSTYSGGRKVTRKATSTITTRYLPILIGCVIGLPFGGFGAIPGMILGAIVGTFISPKVTEIVDDTLYQNKNEEMWICTNCGHVHFGPAAPHVCPVCSKERGYFLNKMYFTIL